MSNTDGTCEYVLDPDDPETWGGEEGDECYVDEEVLNEDGVWTCPHDAEEDKDLCIFHIPNSEKDSKDATDKLVNKINNSEKRNREEFIGSVFSKFKIKVEDLGTEIEDSVALSHSTFGEIQAEDTTINIEFDLKGSVFKREADFRDVKFNRRIDFTGSQFFDVVHFTGSTFNSQSRFDDAKFHESVYFLQVTFSTSTSFTECEFDSRLDFSKVSFSAGVLFSRSSFSKVDFFNASVSGADFRDANFGQGVDFSQVDFSGFGNFWRVTFEGWANFRGVDFSQPPEFNGAKFNGGGSFESVDLTASDFTGAKLTNLNFEGAILSRATLFGSDMRGSRISGTVLGDVRINEDTDFLGNVSENREKSINNSYCIYDPKHLTDPQDIDENMSELKSKYEAFEEMGKDDRNIDKAKSVYRALEELGRNHARPRLQARSFVRRQDLQKKGYWDDATADDVSLEERFIAGARWSRARVARATLLYGESPWRVIAWSLGIIFSFALLYPLGGWMKPTDGDPITYAQIASNPVEILNSVYYSTLTYTALGFGDFQPVGFGRLLTTVETGLGAVMLALLVFILGRRAAR